MADENKNRIPGADGDDISFDIFAPKEEAPTITPEEDTEEGDNKNRPSIREARDKYREAQDKIKDARESYRNYKKSKSGGGEGVGEGAGEGLGEELAEGGGEAAAKGIGKQAAKEGVEQLGKGAAKQIGKQAVVKTGEVLGEAAAEEAAGSAVPVVGNVAMAVVAAAQLADIPAQIALGGIGGEYKKVELPEFVFISLIMLGIDVFCLFLYIIFIGFFVVPFIRIFVFAGVSFWWLFGKGGPKRTGLMSWLINLVLAGLPIPFTLTASFAVRSFLHNKPLQQLEEAAGKDTKEKPNGQSAPQGGPGPSGGRGGSAPSARGMR